MDERMQELDRAIRAASADQQRLKQLSAQLDDLYRQQAERREKLDEAAQNLRNEEKDVEDLEHLSFKALWTALTGDKEERLSRERREALAAKCKYDQAAEDLRYLEEKLTALIGERNRLQQIPHTLERLWSEKADLLKARGGAVGEELTALDRERAELDGQEKELREAISAGEYARRLLEAVQTDLDSAASWGTWDMLGGGTLVTMAKHQRLDSAQTNISAAQRALSAFRTELADVGQLEVPNVEIGSFATFADFFFDDIFSDWYVQTGIRNAQDGISDVRWKVNAALERLRRARETLEERRENLEARRKELLTDG